MTDPDLHAGETGGHARRLAIAGALGLLSLASVAWVLATRRIPDSADQAIVGLMGIQILEGRGHPVFYFGSTYGGSFEAHLVAGAFALFGVSTTTYRGVMVLLAIAVVLSVWGVARIALNSASAWWAVAYLALPPFFFLYKVLTSDGHYATACLLASAMVGSALWQRTCKDQPEPSPGPAATLGLAGGLGLWISPLAPPFFAATVVWLALVEGRRFRFRHLALLALGFVAGSFPWWFWNARHGWASLQAPEAAIAPLGGILANAGRLFSTSLPILLGASLPQALPTALGLRISVLLAAGVVLALAVRRAVLGHEATGLLVWVFFVVLAVSVLPARFDPLEPRFLVTAYVVFAPLFGAAVLELWRGGLWKRAGAVLLVAVVGVLNVRGLTTARRHLGIVPGSSSVTGPLGGLVAELGRLGVTTTWTSYWASYRITFESRERVIAAPLAADEWYRWEPYQRAVLDAADPAVVLLPDRARMFEEYLAERGLRRSRRDVEGFTIFTALEAGTIEVLRRSLSLPMPRSAYRVEWINVAAPRRLGPGGKGMLVARYRNLGEWDWSAAVHLGARLRGPGANGPRRELPVRGYPAGWTAAGQEGRAQIEFVAPLEAGQYDLEVDLVHECVDWFATNGGSPTTLSLEVR